MNRLSNKIYFKDLGYTYKITSHTINFDNFIQ